MWVNVCRRCVIVPFLLVALAAPIAACAQEKKEQAKEEPPAPAKDPIVVLPWETTERGINTCAWTACMGALPPPGHWQPWGVLGARTLASADHLGLELWQFRFDLVFPINQVFLDEILDQRTLPDMRAKVLRDLARPDRAFYLSYRDALTKSHRATQEMFEKSGEEYKKVPYTHLATHPKQYRGKVITIKGKISFIRESNAPDQELGVVYTTYIVGPTKGAPPFTIVFTELPQGAEVSERLDLTVTCQGYFLAHIRYPAEKERDAKKDIISPYLIGKTLIVHPQQGKVPDDDKTAFAYHILAWTVGGIVIVALLVGMLNVWLRSGDRSIQSQLADVRDKYQPFNIEPATESPPLATPLPENLAPPLDAAPAKDEGIKAGDAPVQPSPPTG